MFSSRHLTDAQILAYLTHPKHPDSSYKGRKFPVAEFLRETMPTEWQKVVAESVEIQEQHREAEVVDLAKDLEIPPHRQHNGVATTGFPRYKLLPVWQCSNGREFGTEIEALREELDLERCKAKQHRRASCS